MSQPRRTAVRRRKSKPGDGPMKFPMAERRQIGQFLGIEHTDPVIMGLIAVSRESGLSVFRGELFAIDTLEPLRDADGVVSERWTKRPAAGRDGFLAVARRQKGFKGITGDVVCANDAFTVDWDVAASIAPKVRHTHAPLAAGSSAAAARDYRGAIIGAWAKGYRSDGMPFFYFAHLREHGRRYATEMGVQWAGAWEYTSAMILKSAMSYVLRIMYGITGVVPADELKNDPTVLDQITAAPEQALDVADAIPEELRGSEAGERLLAAVRAANDLDATLWPSAKCEMTFGGQTAAALERLAGEIEAQVEAERAKLQHPQPEEPMPEPGPSTTLPEPGNHLPT